MVIFVQEFQVKVHYIGSCLDWQFSYWSFPEPGPTRESVQTVVWNNRYNHSTAGRESLGWIHQQPWLPEQVPAAPWERKFVLLPVASSYMPYQACVTNKQPPTIGAADRYPELCAQLPCHSAEIGDFCDTSTHPAICQDHKAGLVWLPEGRLCLQKCNHRRHEVLTGQCWILHHWRHNFISAHQWN